MSSSTDLDRVRRAHQLRSLRIAAVLRIGVVAVMTGAMVMGTSEREWPMSRPFGTCIAGEADGTLAVSATDQARDCNHARCSAA